MGLNPKAPACTPGPSSSEDRRGDSLARKGWKQGCTRRGYAQERGWSRNAGSRRVEPTHEKDKHRTNLLYS